MNIIEEATKKGSAYYPRRETDKLFELPYSQYHYEGCFLETVDFITKKQLLDAPLWALFVDLFRGNPDDHDHGWRCEYWGKMMRGACFTYQVTKDKKLYAVLTETVKDMMSVQDGEGRISTYSKEVEFNGWDIWGRKYIMLGFQYFYEICTDEALKAQIMDVVIRHADYIIAHIGEEEGKKSVVKASDHWGGVNSSSILEPYMRLYNMTGKERYLTFSRYLVERGGCENLNLWQSALDHVYAPYELPITKAYEIMSYFEGVLEYYRITKEEKYRTAVLNFVNSLIDTEVTLIGTAGCDEESFNHAAVVQYSTKLNWIMQETCVTVTWMKLCSAILAMTGESRFADQMETSAWNALLGAVNTQEVEINGGLPFDSYTPSRAGTRGMYTGGKKNILGERFYGCCACIGSAGPAVYVKQAVMSDAVGFAVNFYLNAPDDSAVKFVCVTDYPADGHIKLTVETESANPFAVCLRIPAWSSKTRVSVDGQDVNGAAAGEYLKLYRDWNGIHVIDMELDMRCRMVSAQALPDDPEAAKHCALLYGPLVLAKDARMGYNVDEAVEIAADAEGYVDAKLVGGMLVKEDTVSFDTLVTLEVPLTDESTLMLCDCSSAGKTWDQESRMAIWMKTK